MGLVVVQQFILSLLDGLELPYGIPAAKAYITPPDPRGSTALARINCLYLGPVGQEATSSAAHR